jgi:F-type H+-transporting ATPase subunit gamma
VVVATSDRGLAGGFNSSIVRAARERITRLQAEGKQVRVLTVGRKARDQLRRLYGDLSVGEFEAGGNPSVERAEEIAARIRELFDAGEVDVVTLFYSRFASVISQVPTAKQLIPAEVQAGGPVVDLKGASYEYEPDEAGILEALLPRNLTTQVFSAMLENQAGFFAAQMTAMDNATRNAGDMIASLTLQMNRARQAQITKELIEIISGAEAI